MLNCLLEGIVTKTCIGGGEHKIRVQELNLGFESLQDTTYILNR